METMDMDIKQRVKLVCKKSKITMAELAKRLGAKAPALSIRLENGKFTKAELEKIAEAAGCKYFCCFRFSDGEEFSASNIAQQIKDALAHINMSVAELGRKFGLTRCAMWKRVKNGKFTQKDLETLAGYMGCEYITEFQFEDGVSI